MGVCVPHSSPRTFAIPCSSFFTTTYDSTKAPLDLPPESIIIGQNFLPGVSIAPLCHLTLGQTPSYKS